MKKLIIIQGILIAVLLGAVIYVYTRPANETATEQEATPQANTGESEVADPTADWKTHTDDYGFSFKYPKDFSLDISRPAEYNENFPLKVIVVFPPYESANTIEFSLIKGMVKKSPSDEICKSIDTTLNGIPGIKRLCGDAGSASVSYSVQLKNGIALTVRIARNEGPETREIAQEITSAIVSSLTVSQ